MIEKQKKEAITILEKEFKITFLNDHEGFNYYFWYKLPEKIEQSETLYEAIRDTITNCLYEGILIQDDLCRYYINPSW